MGRSLDLCAPTVLIGGLPAARIGDLVQDPVSPDAIVQSSHSVKIGGSFAARLGDGTAAGGEDFPGCFTVWIGDKVGSGPTFCLECAAKAAAAFVSGL